MKMLLVTSLILNVLLLGAAARRGKQKASVQFPRPLRVQVSAPKISKINLFKRSSPQQPPATPWQRIESSNPAQFMANLRAIGCPEQTMRDIHTELADLNEEAVGLAVKIQKNFEEMGI